MQQHPNLLLNKIKFKSCSSLCSYGWCTCVYQPHPCCNVLSSAQQIRTRRTFNTFPRKWKEFRMEVKPGGLHQAARPKIVAVSTNTSFPKQHKPSLHAYEKIPKFCHRCRPTGPSCQPYSKRFCMVTVPDLSVLILPGFIQIHPN